jgi:GTPase SAR1 family protein
LTDRESFDCIDHWLKELRENCDENCEIALVANKIDLINDDPSLR